MEFAVKVEEDFQEIASIQSVLYDGLVIVNCPLVVPISRISFLKKDNFPQYLSVRFSLHWLCLLTRYYCLFLNFLGTKEDWDSCIYLYKLFCILFRFKIVPDKLRLEILKQILKMTLIDHKDTRNFVFTLEPN